MNRQDQINELLDQWHAAREAGLSLTIDELCQARPELRDDVTLQIAALQSAPAPSPAPVPPDTAEICPWPQVPGFQPLRRLGQGGAGVVFAARQERLNRVVAIKVLHRTHAFSARFHTEAESLAALSHPNVVQVLEYGEHHRADGTIDPYLVMEYCERGSLAEMAQGEPQAPRLAAELVGKIARAVHAAHERGIIHRDLKPGNVLLTGAGEPKVSDFGVAKFIEVDAGLTVDGMIFGTPNYMSPEQAEGKVRDIDARSDVYSLAAILYELLTGRPPFKGRTNVETLELVKNTPPVAPSQLVPRVPRDLETICLKGLEKSADQRYQSAADLADDVQRFLDGRPIFARRASLPEQAWKWARRNPLPTTLIVLVVLLTIAAPIVYVSMRDLSALAEERRRRLEGEQRSRQVTTRAAESSAYSSELFRAKELLLDRQPGWLEDAFASVGSAAARDVPDRSAVELRSITANLCGSSDIVLDRSISFPTRVAIARELPGRHLLAVCTHLSDMARPRLEVSLVDTRTWQVNRVLLVPNPLPFIRNDTRRLVPDGITAVMPSRLGPWLLIGLRSGRLLRWDLDHLDRPPVELNGRLPLAVRRIVEAPAARRMFAVDDHGLVQGWSIVEGDWPVVARQQFDANHTRPGLAVHQPVDGPEEVIVSDHEGWHRFEPARWKQLDECGIRGLGPLLEHPSGTGVIGADRRDVTLFRLLPRASIQVRTFRDQLNVPIHGGQDAVSGDGSMLSTAGALDGVFTRRFFEVGSAGRSVEFPQQVTIDSYGCFCDNDRFFAAPANQRLLLYRLVAPRARRDVANYLLRLKNATWSPDGQTIWSLAHTENDSYMMGFREPFVRPSAVFSNGGDRPTDSMDLDFSPAGDAWAYGGFPEHVHWGPVGSDRRWMIQNEDSDQLLRFDRRGRLWVCIRHEARVYRTPFDNEEGPQLDYRYDHRPVGHKGNSQIHALAVSPHGVAIGGRDGACVWHAIDQNRVIWRTVPDEEDSVRSIVIAPDGASVYFGCRTGNLLQLSTATGQVTWTHLVDGSSLESLAIAPDGKTLVAGTARGQAHFFRRTNDGWSPYFRLRHPSMVRVLRFHPHQNRLMIVGRGDLAVTIWDLDELNRQFTRLAID